MNHLQWVHTTIGNRWTLKQIALGRPLDRDFMKIVAKEMLERGLVTKSLRNPKGWDITPQGMALYEHLYVSA